MRHDERGGGDAVALHELLGEDLAALDLGGPLARPEDRQAASGELVGETQGQRQLGADHRQVDPHLLREVGEAVHLFDRGRHEVGDLADPRIPRRAVEIAQPEGSGAASSTGRARGRRFR